MSKRFRILTVALLLVASAGLATPALGQSPGLVSATPQQKDAWGEDIVRYCAAEIQASIRADVSGNEKQRLAEHLDDLAVDDLGFPKSYEALETFMATANEKRAYYAETAKNPKRAKYLPDIRDEMIRDEARACMAGRALTLISASRETVTIWNKSPDAVDVWLNITTLGCVATPSAPCNVPTPTAPQHITDAVGGGIQAIVRDQTNNIVDVWLNNALRMCSPKAGEFCNVSVPTGASASIIGEVGGTVKYGPFRFEPAGDAARTIILHGPGQ